MFAHHCPSHRYDEQQKKVPFQKFPREPQRGDQKLNLAVSKVDTLFLKVPFSQFCLLAPSFCTAYLLTSSSVQARFHKSSLAATIHLFIFIVQMDCVWMSERASAAGLLMDQLAWRMGRVLLT